MIGDAFLYDGADVLGGVERRLLLQEADLDAGLRARFALELRVDAAMILSSVDLPEPFKPRTPIFAPGKKLRLMSRRM